MRKPYSRVALDTNDRQTNAASFDIVMNVVPYVAVSQARFIASKTEGAPELFPSSPVQK